MEFWIFKYWNVKVQDFGLKKEFKLPIRASIVSFLIDTVYILHLCKMHDVCVEGHYKVIPSQIAAFSFIFQIKT